MRIGFVLLTVVMASLAGCSEKSAAGNDSDAGQDPAPLPFDCAAASYQPSDLNVTIATTAGEIQAVLYGAASPLTVCNFLQYVEANYYDETIWHRVCPHVIQAGGLDVLGQSKPERAPIRNEAPESQLRNYRGTIAMARTSDPDSATTHFFVNLKDNLYLDFDGDYAPGFAVFGNVTAGWDVVERIAATMVVPTPQVPPVSGGCTGQPVPTMETTISDIRVAA